MVSKTPKIVIIGAGMAGLTAAHKLFTTPGAKNLFDLCVVDGGDRVGGRINTTEFCGDKIEMGATWIHGIEGNPVYEIAQKIKSLESNKPWEFMDGFLQDKVSMAEGGFMLDSSMVQPISALFYRLINHAQGKVEECSPIGVVKPNQTDPVNPTREVVNGTKMSNFGSFLKLGLEEYWASKEQGKEEEVKVCGNWTKKMLEEAIFAAYENIQRTYTAADDLFNLDFNAENECQMFPGEDITIPRGYITIIQSLASVLSPGLIQLGRKVVNIEWIPSDNSDQTSGKPVKLHFDDGSIMEADHLIVTVSLGVLKAGLRETSSLFTPSLPSTKEGAISRLGYGVVNKLFLQLSTQDDKEEGNSWKFPRLQMVFHREDSAFRNRNIPWWMRKTAALYPIYNNSNVLLSWFGGKEALELETLEDEMIIDGVSTTVKSFIPSLNHQNQENPHPHDIITGNMERNELVRNPNFEFQKVLKSKWGSDPLFLGSYSYVAAGSSGEDFDIMAKPLPEVHGGDFGSGTCDNPLQILFAGEATHRTHYSTTHGAYLSGIREASRLLQHYNLNI